MPIKDNDLVAQYIRAIENPDSIGYKEGKWYQPSNSKYDKNNRGFGVDVVHNKAARGIVSNRQGKWLTEEEERELRNKHIIESQKVLDKRVPWHSLRETPSEEKNAMAIGMLYRGDSVLGNQNIRDAYYSGSDEDMQRAVSEYYKAKKVPERSANHNKFFNSRKPKGKMELNYKPRNWFPEYQSYSKGGQLYGNAWDSLPLADKAEMIKVAVANGITALPEIRSAYNEFAKGGYIPSDSIKKRISNWEGSSMKTNRSFEDEARDFNRVVPTEVRDKLTQQQKDALYSYGYNVGMGNLKERVVPTLTAYTEGKASKEDVQRSMWAKRDNELRGLTTRRNAEREMFGGNYRTKFTGTGGLGIHLDPSEYTIPQSFFDNFNAGISLPQMQMPNGIDADPETLYKAPTIDETLFSKPEVTQEELVYNPQQEKVEGLKRMTTVMGLLGQNIPFAGLADTNTPGLLSYVNQIYNS